MAWVAVDKNKREFIYNTKPRRFGNYCWHFDYDEDSESLSGTVSLPNGTIKKLIGRDLTWEDEPVELK